MTPSSSQKKMLAAERSPVWSSAGSQQLLSVVLLLVLTLTALAGACENGTVNLDDDMFVLNDHVRSGLTPDNIAWAFTTLTAGNWHPLTWLSYQLDATFFNPKPAVFHTSSLLFHLANVLLLAEVLRQLTGSLWRSFVVAALFAVHPLHVESVAWISERKDVLSTFFGLLALLAYVSYVRRPSVLRMTPVVLLLAASLMSKPMLVTLPFLLLLLDFWPLRRLSWTAAATPRPEPAFAPAPLFWLVAEKGPLFLLSAGSCPMTLIGQAAGGAVSSTGLIPLSLRLANAVHATVCYIGQTFYPFNLAVLYPYPLNGLPWPQVLAETLFLSAITAAVCWQIRPRPYLAVGWFWYLGTLVPVIGLVQVGMQSRADRYTYVPLIGLFLLLVWGAAELFDRRSKGLLAVLTASVLLSCVILTQIQVSYWADSRRLWKHAVESTTENLFAHINYARVLFDERDNQAALDQLTEAIRFVETNHEGKWPLGLAAGYWFRGKILLRLNRWDEAEASFHQATSLDPGNKSYQEGLLDFQKKRQQRGR